MSVRRMAQGLALSTIVTPGAAWSLGLGDINVDTALNQPLRAEIRLLSVTPGELENMRVSLASQETFERIGIQRPFVLSQLQFKPVQSPDGHTVVEVTTRQPIREPFLNFLVEVEWPNGRLLREYTVLLDPPVLMEQRAATSVQAPVIAAQAASPQAKTRIPANLGTDVPVQSVPVRGQASTASSAPAADVTGDTPVDYTVVSGDTLGDIAERYRPDEGISLSQMMVAILRANPDAFAEENINNLMTGAILRIPPSDAILAVDSQAAVAEVARQNSLWREYRTQLEAAVPPQLIEEPAAVSPESDAAETQAEIEQRTPELTQAASDEDAQLRIMAADEGVDAPTTSDAADSGDQNVTMQAEGELAQELAEARRVQIESLQSKVAELESIVAKQERLISLQTEALAQLQARLDGTQAPASEALQDEAGGATDELAIAPVEAVDAAAAGTSQTFSVPQTANDVAEDTAAADSTGNVVGVQAESKASPSRDAAELSRSTTLLEDILANPAMLAGIGTGALLLLVVIWLVVRRGASTRAQAIDLASYQDEELDRASSLQLPLAAIASTPTSDVAEKVAPVSPPAPPVSREDVIAAPALETTQMARETVQREVAIVDDTLAEADVYIAYGLQQQAEDLLKEAVHRDPKNHEYRLKLLEVFYAAKNVPAFEAEAQALQALLDDGSGELWTRVVNMGVELSPHNPLFAGVAAAIQPSAPTQLETASPNSDLTTRAEADYSLSAVETERGVSGQAQSAVSAEARDEHLLEFEAADLETTVVADLPAATTPAPQDEVTLDFDLSDLDLNRERAGTAIDSMSVVLGDQGQTTGQAKAQTSSDLRADEPMAMTLDDGNKMVIDAETPARSSSTVLELDDFDLASLDASPADNEVGTKLDLARAYLDMGDADGALSTLEEVLQEGDEDQRQTAEMLKRQIA
jgi:pilus assembly protein FimV